MKLIKFFKTVGATVLLSGLIFTPAFAAIDACPVDLKAAGGSCAGKDTSTATTVSLVEEALGSVSSLVAPAACHAELEAAAEACEHKEAEACAKEIAATTQSECSDANKEACLKATQTAGAGCADGTKMAKVTAAPEACEAGLTAAVQEASAACANPEGSNSKSDSSAMGCGVNKDAGSETKGD